MHITLVIKLTRGLNKNIYYLSKTTLDQPDQEMCKSLISLTGNARNLLPLLSNNAI
jgi:hypothetical protein